MKTVRCNGWTKSGLSQCPNEALPDLKYCEEHKDFEQKRDEWLRSINAQFQPVRPNRTEAESQSITDSFVQDIKNGAFSLSPVMIEHRISVETLMLTGTPNYRVSMIRPLGSSEPTTTLVGGRLDLLFTALAAIIALDIEESK